MHIHVYTYTQKKKNYTEENITEIVSWLKYSNQREFEGRDVFEFSLENELSSYRK